MAHVATITIDHTKVPGDLTDYVGLIVPDGSAGYAALYALCLEGGGDIRLFKSDDTTELAREIVSFSVSAETGEIHYKYSGTLSSSVDTDIHVYADGSSADYAVTATYGRNNVWSGYKFASHNGGGTDSSGNVTTTANGGVSAGGATGKIGEATEFDGSNDNFTTNYVPSSAIGSGDLTVSILIKAPSPASNGWPLVMSDNAGYSNSIGFRTSSGSANLLIFFRDGSSGNAGPSASGVIDDTWHFIHLTRSGTTAISYIDGALESSVTNSEIASDGGNGLIIGQTGGQDFDGLLDEVRISNSVLTANWITTEHNNQNSYSTFYSVAAVAGGSTPAQAARRGAVMMM